MSKPSEFRLRAGAGGALVLLLALLVFAAFPAAPATAGTTTLAALCQESPVATAPIEDIPAETLGARSAQGATGKDPFQKNSGTTVYREYGWLTEYWPTYDLDCGPDAAAEPTAIVSTFFANMMISATLFGSTIFDVTIHAVVSWTGLGFIDDSLESLVAAIRGDVWVSTMTVAGAFAALWFMFFAMRGDTKKVVAAAVWSGCALLLFGMMVSYPTKSAAFFDTAVQSSVAAAYGGEHDPNADPETAGKQIADGIVGQVYQIGLYDRWCEGMVGSSKTAAERWCPRLWKSMYLSKTEARTTGDARSDLLEDKADDFEDIAGEIEEDDPAAYQVLQGKAPMTRLVVAGTAGMILYTIVFFPTWAVVLVFVALLMLRVLILFAPILGPVVAHPAMRPAGRAILNLLGAAAINAVVFAFASAVYLRIAEEILAPNSSSMLMRLIVLLMLNIAMWVITRPWRRLTGLGKGVNKSVEGFTGRMTKEGMVKTAVAAGKVATAAATIYTSGGTSAIAGGVQQVAENTNPAQQRRPMGPMPVTPEPYEGRATTADSSTRRSTTPPTPAGRGLPAGSVAGTAYRDEQGSERHAQVFDDPSATPGTTEPRPAEAGRDEDGKPHFVIYSPRDKQMRDAGPAGDGTSAYYRDASGAPAGGAPETDWGDIPTYTRGGSEGADL